MTPDKEHAPALMQQAADEAKCREPGCGALRAAPCHDWDCPQQTMTYAEHEKTIAILTTQLSAAEAKVAVAVNPPPAGYESWQAWLENPPPPTPALRELMRKFRENQNSAPPAPTYEQGIAAGLEMAAKVAEKALEPLAKLSSDVEWDDVPDNARADVVYRSEAGGEESVGTIAFADFRRARAAIRALADQHKPSPAEEPMP